MSLFIVLAVTQAFVWNITSLIIFPLPGRPPLGSDIANIMESMPEGKREVHRCLRWVERRDDPQVVDRAGSGCVEERKA